MIVPVFNGMKYIDLFFEPIKRYNPKIEIIFIDNGSEDGSYNYINELTLSHELHRVHSFVDKKSSYAARNFGVMQSHGSVYAFTDIDCILTNKYFETLFNLDLSENSLITGPTEIFTVDGNIYEHFDKAAYLKQDEYAKANYAATANLIVGKKLYDLAGGFPEFTSGADNKFCKNCYRLGAILEFSKDLIVKHPPRSSLEDHYAKAYRLGLGHGEIFIHSKPSFLQKIKMLSKQLSLLLIPINSFRLFFRVSNEREMSFLNYFQLAKLSYMVSLIQRIQIINVILNGNEN